MNRVHIAYVSPEHCDIAAELGAVARLPANRQPAFVELCARYGLEGPVGAKPFAFGGGLAVIPVHGLLINRSGYSGGQATGYDFIRAQLRSALADPEVSAIVFDLNSPGGTAAGCSELAQEIYDSRAVKPSLAVVDSMCYSGGYYLGSAATRIVASPTSGIGSIGVVAMHVDASKALEQEGLNVTFIHAGSEKVDGNMYEPLSERARARIEGTVDYHYGMFVDAVARQRNMSADDVRATEARCYTPPEALEAGLIDGIANPIEAIRGIVDTGGEMADVTQAEAARLAGEAAAQAVAAERARSAAIRTAPEAEGRTALADHLVSSTDMTVEAARAVLAAAPKQEAAPAPGNALNAAMAASPGPSVGADNADNVGAGRTPDRILANYGQVTGHKFRPAVGVQ